MDGTIQKFGDGRLIRFERVIAQPIEKVWAALTISERIADWLASGGAEIEPRTGGRYKLIFKAPPYAFEGTIHAYEPPNLLEYTWPEAGRPDSLVRFLLVPNAKGTLLRLTQSWPREGRPADRLDHLFIQPKHYEASLRFFSDVLGWRPQDDDPGSRLANLSLPGGASLVIADHHDEAGDGAQPHGVNGAHPTIHFRVGDVDALFAAMPKGPHIQIAPADTHWGTRWCVVADPDGNLFAFESGRERAGAALSACERAGISGALAGWHWHLDRMSDAIAGAPLDWNADEEAALQRAYAERIS